MHIPRYTALKPPSPIFLTSDHWPLIGLAWTFATKTSMSVVKLLQKTSPYERVGSLPLVSNV